MIFVSPQPTLMPILREVQELGLTTINPQFVKILGDTDIKAQDFSATLTDKARNMAVLDAVRIVTELSTNPVDTKSLVPAVQDFLTVNLPSYIYTRINDMALLIRGLDELQPKVALVHNDVEPLNRTVALWAKARGVPCLHVPHAIYLENEGRGAIGTDVHDLITASHIAVAGAYQHTWYAMRDNDHATICITGLPQFDRLQKPVVDHARACQLFHFSPMKPVIVYMSSWRQDTNLLGCHDGIEESYLAFLNAAKVLPDLQYIVKCHPRGNNVAWHVQEAEKLGVKCAVTDQHLDVVMNAADVVLSYGPSNVILECATLNNAHLIVVGDSAAFPNDPEIVKVSADSAQITDALRTCLAQPLPDYRVFVQKYLGVLDGQAYMRIAAWLRELHG